MTERLFYREAALEAIARKVIKEYDPSLLAGEPVPIPIEEMIEKQFHLSLEYQILRKSGHILGITVFEDDYVPVYDSDAGQYTLLFFPKGTIIIDEGLLHDINEGRLRFTCAHELAHWILHLEFYTESGNMAAMQPDARKSIDANKMLEWQADRLASELLMPTGMVKKAFYRNRSISVLAKQFQVSRQSMEIKLRSRGLI